MSECYIQSRAENGYKMNSIYLVVSVLFVSLLPGSTSYESQYIGCFKDSTGSRAMIGWEEEGLTGDKATIPYCINKCKELGFTYAGLEYSDECYCGEEYDKYGMADDDDCDDKCKGDSTQICGGSKRLSVYRVCPSGRHSSQCSQMCSEHCYKDTCRFSGACFRCDTGYLGTFCNDTCPAGMYGDNCANTCSGFCKAESCIPTSQNGECPGKKCKAGYQGDDCNEKCESGKYGENCRGNCSEFCQYPPCVYNSPNGTCPMEKCLPGYQGPTCTLECEPGTYGENCTGKCSEHCKLGACVATSIDGVCPNKACMPGYQAPYCLEVCSNGTYGDNCKQICAPSCTLGCHPVTGACISSGTNATIIAVTVVIFLVLLLCVAVIVAVVVRRKRLMKSKGNANNKADAVDRLDDVSPAGRDPNCTNCERTDPEANENSDLYEMEVMVDNEDKRQANHQKEGALFNGMVENEFYEADDEIADKEVTYVNVDAVKGKQDDGISSSSHATSDQLYDVAKDM